MNSSHKPSKKKNFEKLDTSSDLDALESVATLESAQELGLEAGLKKKPKKDSGIDLDLNKGQILEFANWEGQNGSDGNTEIGLDSDSNLEKTGLETNLETVLETNSEEGFDLGADLEMGSDLISLGSAGYLDDSLTNFLGRDSLLNAKKRDVFVSEAIIRPTGLLDPEIIVKPVDNQVDDILEQVRLRISKNQRVIITTLTKKFAEELDIYLKNLNVKSAYIHSDVDTLERLDIIKDLREGAYDVLIGINLLREGIDLPEVSLVAIFDADKEGFLRSRTSLIQIIGRAARHEEGQVIMYASVITDSMEEAIEENNRRRQLQWEYNQKHGITPHSASRKKSTIADQVRENSQKDEDWGQAGAVLTPFGFVEKDSNSKKTYTKNSADDLSDFDLSDGMEFEIESRFKSRGKKGKGQDRAKNKGQQVYASFQERKAEKEKEILEASTVKFSFDQLQKKMESVDPIINVKDLENRLKKAIAEYDFESAAAIRDILKSMNRG